MIVSVVVLAGLLVLGLASAVTNDERWMYYLVLFMLVSVAVLPVVTIL